MFHQLKTVWPRRCAGIILLSTLATLCAAENPSWEAGANFRRQKLQSPQNRKAGFSLLPAASLGVRFTNHVERGRSILNRHLLNGSGVAAGDIDSDGYPDLYLCGLDPANALYRNLGDWKFEDITVKAGVACPNMDATGAVFADTDGDGDLDLLVSGLGSGVRLFRNDGQARFTEITADAGLASKTGAMSLALADIDGDEDLDLFVVNYRLDTIADQPTTTFQVQIVEGRPVVATVNGQSVTLPQWTNRFIVAPSGQVEELGEASVLYLNDGKGKFTAVAFTSGAFVDEDGRPLTEAPGDWGLAARFHDFTGDGAPDLYICNDLFSPDRIWINNGKGQFRAIARTAIRTTSTFSMGVDFADVDRDGHIDFFVVDMLSPDHRKRHVQIGERSSTRWPIGAIENRPQFSRNTLQLNRGDNTFAEIAWFAGVQASDWSWGPAFVDVDLDGYEDILVPNGVMRDFQNIDFANRMEAAKSGKKLTQSEILEYIGQFPMLKTPKVAYRNKGDRTFDLASTDWGFDAPGISQGMALADLDNDGDLDVIINNLDDAPSIYRNDAPASRVAIRLKGTGANSEGIGAQLEILGGPVRQTQEMVSGGRYLSGDQVIRTFAAGNQSELKVRVKWRSGKESQLTAAPGYLYEINERESGAPPERTAPPIRPLFVEFTNVPPIRVVEPFFDDQERQPLLTRLLSQAGPSATWHDVNLDGWDDLLIGGARGGRLNVLLNQEGKAFSMATNAVVGKVLARDQTTILASLQNLLVGSSNYEDGLTNGGLIRVYDFQRGVSGENLPGHPFSCGPLVLADIDADGDLDLFVGGRVVPGRYPEPSDSLLFRNESGRFLQAQRWEKLGLVNGAVFSDLDADGFPELILATEWGPVRVFKQGYGKYEEQTQAWGLSEWTGWWNGVVTGDFDGDGHLDIASSNWGRNSPYATSRAHPRKLYYGDLDGNGVVDLIETTFNRDMGKEVPETTFNFFRASMPFVQERVPDFTTYGTWSVQEIFGEELKKAAILEAATFDSTVFLWRNGKFEARSLPAEAQFAPAFGLAAADFDGDGSEDLFLAQNFFALSPFESRCDAGRGLVLKGKGNGDFEAVPGQSSGISIYGDQRACAASDFDADGRVDLAVTQNGNPPKIYRNLEARPGLRVRLRGIGGNAEGIGAALRIETREKPGAIREVLAGSGYLSQNSFTQVLPWPGTNAVSRIWIRWPGGKETRSNVPRTAREVEVSYDGNLKVVK